DEKVIFEGAQGSLLDLDYGTYPFVTSSHPIAAGACLGTGIGPRHIDRIIGVVKAYTTRVGTGPMPTELHDEDGEKIRRRGNEFGTTTGRPRRCGWLDVVLLRHSAQINSLDALSVMLLDVLSTFPTLKICTAYRTPDGVTEDFPADRSLLDEVEPIYEELPGWSEEITEVRSVADLPTNARRYLKRIEELVGVPVEIVSVGPDREQTIFTDRPRPETTIRAAA
ncbi:MAG: adenylosuccinate synthetase, partial [Armatimonadetes bacterium]|nr:adenylosuccinate synthetase [Armatimonadota bacterium]